jgi:hypothetical protein
MTRKSILQAIALFVVIALFLLGTAVLDVREEQRNLEITCSIAESSHLELQAITRNGIVIVRIARSLGLPIMFPPSIDVPEVPEECDESLS